MKLINTKKVNTLHKRMERIKDLEKEMSIWTLGLPFDSSEWINVHDLILPKWKRSKE